MNKQSIQFTNEELKELQTPAFGYELIREVLIPTILGKDYSHMLYWAGKELARKYPLSSTEEMISFFENAGWGNLTVLSLNKNEMEFELSGDLISLRLGKDNNCSFQLEAGFIAEQLQTINSYITETHEQIKKRAKKVVFTAKWDHKDKIEAAPIVGKRSERK